MGLHHLLGYLRRYDEADKFAASWIKDHPRDGDFAFQVAELAIARNQFDQAYARLVQLQAQNADDPLVLNNLAAVMVLLHKPGALPYAQKAAEIVPGDARILDTLAAAQAEEKQLDQALVTQKQAVAASQDNDVLRLHLADIALKANDKALARTELTRLRGLGDKFKQQDEVTRLLKTL
jgi:Flp pilus assembly protein TadD